MHSMKIVHRDVKPENVMIIDRPTEEGLYPEVWRRVCCGHGIRRRSFQFVASVARGLVKAD